MGDRSLFDELKQGIETLKNTRWRTTSDEEKNPTPLPKKAVKVQKTTVTAVPEDDRPATGPDGKYLKPTVQTTMKKGGKVSSASKRADGCAIRGKTRA